MLVNVYIPSNRASKQIYQKGPKNKLDIDITVAGVVKREKGDFGHSQRAPRACRPGQEVGSREYQGVPRSSKRSHVGQRLPLGRYRGLGCARHRKGLGR